MVARSAPRRPLAALSSAPVVLRYRRPPPPCQEPPGSRIASTEIHQTRPSLGAGVTTFRSIARHAGGWLPVIGASALLGTLGMLAMPYVLGRAVDEIVTGEPGRRWVFVAAGLIGLNVGTGLVGAFAGTACVAGTTARLPDRVGRPVL